MLIEPGILPARGGHAQSAPQKSPQAEPAAPGADYSGEPFVVEQYHTRIRFENDGTGQTELVVRIRVQSDAGVQQLGQLVFGYNAANERLTVDSLDVRKPDGSVTMAPPDAVQDLSAPIEREAPVYTDFRQKHVTVPALRPGDTLSYHVTSVTHTALAPGHFWLERNFFTGAIVLDELLEVNVPGGRAIKLLCQPGAEPLLSEEHGRRIYRWKRANLEREPDGEAKQKSKAKKKPEAPAVQMTTFASWEELGRWYAPLVAERAAPTPEIRAKAVELTRGRTTDLERLEALYDFVAGDFRYVSLSFGVGRYQPHAANSVLVDRYGDCKDKHTLLASLAEAVGLHAYPVLINSSRKLNPEMPSPAQFDHMITAVPLGNTWIWLDTTTEVAPFRMLASRLRGKQALLLPPDATGSNHARLARTPADLPFPASQFVEVKGQVSDLGKLTAHVSYTLRGDTELLLRTAFRRTPQNQWKQLAQLLATADGFRGEASDVTTSDPTATRNPFHVEYQIAQANFLEWSSKKSQLGLPLPRLGLPDVSEAEEGSEKTAEPIEIGTPLDITIRAELTLPAKFALRAPVAVNVTRDYAEYRSLYKLDGNRVTAERSLRFRLHELPALRASDYLAFVRAVRSDEGQRVSLESETAGAPAVPETAKPDELYEAGVAAFQSNNYPAAVQLLERVAKAEPKRKNLWNLLGLSYYLQGKRERAIECFRKQIELDPFDERAEILLGTALAQQGQYSEAEQAFRKQLELNALDRGARAGLGSVLLEQRKYREAAAEFEKAVALEPDDSSLHVDLGRAYLKQGRADDSLKEFDRAVELQPSPVVWNNIAYELSLAHVHLDRAQQYAESAVAAVSAELRNVSLGRLTPQDLEHVSSLAAYWDTLGWVLFEKGDLAAAEKYIRASWMLSQHGEVGDHLAQVYEKTKRIDDARKTYAQALAATRPPADARDRLLLLVGNQKHVDEEVFAAGPLLSEQRTIPLGKLWKENANAEFFVSLVPEAGSAKLEAIKFISGDAKLGSLAQPALSTARYPDLFPDGTPTKLIRRGLLSCSAATGDCLFVLMLPELVTSVN